jgi:hypothetical protein
MRDRRIMDGLLREELRYASNYMQDFDDRMPDTAVIGN